MCQCSFSASDIETACVTTRRLSPFRAGVDLSHDRVEREFFQEIEPSRTTHCYCHQEVSNEETNEKQDRVLERWEGN